MHSPVHSSRVTLAASRSTSCSALGPVADQNSISNSPVRHSSDELVKPPSETSTELHRRSIDIHRRPLPPTPSSSTSTPSSPTPTPSSPSLHPGSSHLRSKSAPMIENPQGSPNAKLLPRRPLPTPPMSSRMSAQLPTSVKALQLMDSSIDLPIMPPIIVPIANDEPSSSAPNEYTILDTSTTSTEVTANSTLHNDLPAPTPTAEEITSFPTPASIKYPSPPKEAIPLVNPSTENHDQVISNTDKENTPVESPKGELSTLNESRLSPSADDIAKEFVHIDSGKDNLRASVDLSGDPNSPLLRSWYLKKNSTLDRSKLQLLPKPEFRTLRKSLPEMIELTPKNKVIKELYVTEALYIDDLCVTIKVFMEPIKRYKILSEGDVSALFSNIQELYEINKALLSSLNELIPQVNEQHSDTAYCPPIGNIFLKHLHAFSAYTTYLCNKELSLRVGKQVDSVPHFKSLMDQFRENPECNGLGLGDYLIKPVQRLCKYPLLFKEMKKYLLQDDPQIPVLTDVISEIEKLTEMTNRNITNLEKLNEIKKLMGNGVSSYLEGATVIREGTLYVVEKKSKKEEVFFWLLDKVILWYPTKATLRKIRVGKKGQNMLLVPSITVLCEEEYEQHKLSFSMKYISSSGKEKTIGFCAKSYLEKLCWIEDIRAQSVIVDI